MSMTNPGTWAVGVWATTVWDDAVWYESGDVVGVDVAIGGSASVFLFATLSQWGR
jgi:hypothetical protein